MLNLFSVGLSGLKAAQRNLTTTGNNVANANTPGYTRQQVRMTNDAAIYTASGYIGTGVNVVTTERVYDQFLNDQVRDQNSQFAQLDTLNSLALSVENVFEDDGAGVASALNGFFQALNDAAADPNQPATRDVVLDRATSLAQSLDQAQKRLDALNDAANEGIRQNVSRINGLAAQLGDINRSIHLSGGQSPNDLLDQRDQLLKDMGSVIGITVAFKETGTATVQVGGYLLVDGNRAGKLAAVTAIDDPNATSIQIESFGSSEPIDLGRKLGGGEIGGYQSFQSTVLAPAQNRLGLLAVGIADAFNTQHRAGFDRNGVAGGDLFALATPPLVGNYRNNAGNGVLAAAIVDVNQMQASDYEVQFGAGQYLVTRLQDGQQTLYASLPQTHDGLDLSLSSGTPQEGDRFLVQATRSAAGNLQSVIADPNLLALGQTAAPNHGPGDNANAVALAGLQGSGVLQNGNRTLNGYLSETTGALASQREGIGIARDGQEITLQAAEQRRDSLSGVNLDEEAADLLRFQQSYAASAQIIAVTQNLFDSLLSAVRG